MSDHSERIYEFGDFRLDVGEAELRRDGTPVALSNKAVEMLNLLIERRSHTVTKDELMSTLWQDTFVDENNLAVTVSNLRKALGVPANDKQFIETVQRRGYRWTADVKETSGNGDTLIVERHSQTRITIQETAEKQSQAVGELERKVGRRSKQFLAITVFVIGLTGALAYAFWNNRNRAGENPGTQNQVSSANAPHSIAVLPFKNVTAENADDPLSIGLTDALISRLGNVKNLAVRPTSAVLQFVGASAMPQTVGEKLNVENVLSGTIQRDGEKIRVSIQLMNTTDGTILWAKKFDESFADVFKIQDLMSGEIADALRMEMPDTERTRLTERPTTDAEAFKLYIRGRYAWNKRTPESLTESIRQFNAAIDRDPTFALAYAALADSYALLSEYNAAPPVETFPKAKAAANRALEIDPNSAEAHTTLAYALASYDWNFNAAEREYKRALELKPNYATAHQWFGEMLFGLQRFEEADIEIARAAVLDPLSPIIQTDIGLLLYKKRDYEAAVAQYHKTIQNFPNFAPAYTWLSLVYERQGKFDEAAAALIDSLRLSGVDAGGVAVMQQTYQQHGWKSLYQLLLDGTEALAKSRYVPAFYRAAYLLRVGDRNRMFEWLEKARDERFRYLAYVGGDPMFDELHDEPRFQEIVRKVNGG